MHGITAHCAAEEAERRKRKKENKYLLKFCTVFRYIFSSTFQRELLFFVLYLES